MILKLQQEPRCPGCAEFLQPCVVEFREGWAWCKVCVQTKLDQSPWMPGALDVIAKAGYSSSVNGVLFYTPNFVAGEVQSAYEIAEASGVAVQLEVVAEQPDGVYALTPSGEHLLSDLNLDALGEVEADLKRVRRRRSREPSTEEELAQPGQLAGRPLFAD